MAGRRRRRRARQARSPFRSERSPIWRFLEPEPLLHEIVTTLVGQATPRRLVLAVDDAHLLDDASASAVHHLVTRKHAQLVASLRSPELCPAADPGAVEGRPRRPRRPSSPLAPGMRLPGGGAAERPGGHRHPRSAVGAEPGRSPPRPRADLGRSPARPHIRLGYEVRSPWWSGDAAVLTFEPAELMSTKLRALNTVNGSAPHRWPRTRSRRCSWTLAKRAPSGRTSS